MRKMIKEITALLLCLFLVSCGSKNETNENSSGKTDMGNEQKESLPDELIGESNEFSHVFVGDDFTLSVPNNYWIKPGVTWTGMVYTINDDIKDYIEKVAPFGNRDTSMGSNYFLWSISEHNDHGMNAAGLFDELYNEKDSSSKGFTVTPEHLSQPVYVIINDLSKITATDLKSGCMKTVAFYLDEPNGDVFIMGGYVLNQEMEQVFLDVIESLEYRNQ